MPELEAGCFLKPNLGCEVQILLLHVGHPGPTLSSVGRGARDGENTGERDA